MPREAGDAAGPWRRPLSYLSPSSDLAGCVVQDSPAIALTVDGHRLSGQGEADRSEVVAGCDLVVYATLDVLDGGETATIGTGLLHTLEGRCGGIDEQLRGDNGLGIDGCTVVVTGEATLDAIE